MNNPYASLFGPRRMKPNPSESRAKNSTGA